MANDFLTTYTPLANDIATQTGMDPSVVLGIIDTETGSGQHVSGNNIFGISPGGRVAGYPDVQTAAQAFVDLMKTKRYQGVAQAGDPASQATALVRGGYNTANPNYAGIVANKALSFGKQLGYQDDGQGGGAPVSQANAPNYDNAPPTQPAPAPAPTPTQAIPGAPNYDNTPPPMAPAPAQPAQPAATAQPPQQPQSEKDRALQGLGDGAPSQPGPAQPQSEKDKALASLPPATEEPQKPPAPPPEQGLGAAAGTIGDFLGAVGHGLSFGLDKPFDAASNWLADKLGMTGYKQLQDYGANREQEFAKQHPLAQATGEAIGAVPSFTGGVGALERVLPSMAGAGIVPRAWNALMTGTRSGIASGAAAGGMAEGDLEDRAKAAAIGAATGVAVPTGFGLIRGILGSTVAPIMARLSGTAAESQATGKIAQALARDQITPAEAQAALTRLGPDATLADVGGANVRNLGETVASTPGAGAQQAESFLEGRQAGAPSRINAAVTAATGSTGDFHAALGDLAQQRATDAAPLYKTAFAKPSGMTAPMQAMLDDPIAQQGLKRGLEIQRIENAAAAGRGEPTVPTTDPSIQYDADGTPRVVGVPNMRSLDAVKRGMDAIIDDNRSDVTGKVNWTERLRAVDSLRKAWVTALDQGNPDYAAARAAWGGPSSAMDALSLGRRALSNDPEVTAKTIASLSPGDREFFKTGVARALKDKIDSVQDGADATRRIFGNQLIRDKIAAGFGDPAAFDEFQKTMEREAQFSNTRREI
ncbi:MAG TPA: glucosaminidase domain-containing protein, partial [Acetobacteraceae bacterium]